MLNKKIEINGHRFDGIEVSLPKAPLVLIKGTVGFVMCGYLNLEAAEKMQVAAAMVQGVSSVEDVLAAKVQGLTSLAKKRGVLEGMTGKEALLKIHET